MHDSSLCTKVDERWQSLFAWTLNLPEVLLSDLSVGNIQQVESAASAHSAKQVPHPNSQRVSGSMRQRKSHCRPKVWLRNFRKRCCCLAIQ